MDEWLKEAETQYAALASYAEMRRNELTGLLHSYIAATDLYGKLLCGVTLILGQQQPGATPLMGQKEPNKQLDIVLRDLIADVFDFLYETRALILKGKLEIAFPLARRAYESLSLLVSCYLEPRFAKRWVAGKEISNSEIRGVLAKHPFGGEPEEKTRELYKFFAGFSHPNRKMMAQRHLGDGNEFVLGSIGQPSLAMLADYALKTLDMWFWFGAVVHWIYLPVLGEVKPNFKESYDAAAKAANEVASYLSEQFNRTLAQEKAELIRDRRRAAGQSNGGPGASISKET
jgi:hypothetical protein